MTKMLRAYSQFEVKALDEDTGEFEGIATTPSVDRMGDIVEPKGAQFTLPLPMLWQHMASQPIGLINSAKVTAKGITVKGQVMKDLLEVPRIAEAWALIKAGLVRGLSIGFAPKESEPIDEERPWNGFRFLKWDWLELSAVTIPANAEASIQTIKAYDVHKLLDTDSVPLDVPAYGQQRVSGTVNLRSTLNLPATRAISKPKGVIEVKKTVREQIEAFEAKYATLVAANEELMEKSGEELRTLNEDEQEMYDANKKEMEAVSAHLVRLRAHEQTQVQRAAPVTPTTGTEGDTSRPAPAAGSGVIYGMKSRLEPGVRFARFAMCIGAAKGNLMQAEMIASSKFKDTPEVALALKSAVAAGTTQDATWASPLVQLQEMQSEFVEFLRPQTLLGRIPGLRRVPFNIKFTRQTAGTSGTFVGEGLPKPLGKMDFELLSLTWAKAATIIVMTEELLRFSNPNAEILARDDLAAGIAQYLDKRFIDPVYAGVANVSPASITNGVTPIPSSGTSIAQITATAGQAIAQLIAAELDPSRFVWLMNPAIALDLSLMRTTQDILAFPDIGPLGGRFLGYPVITSNNVVLSGSPTESFVVLMDPSQVMLADDGGVSIEMSTEASLQMDNAPSAGAAQLVSLWQNNLVALKAERFINWRRRRDAAVAVITMNVKW